MFHRLRQALAAGGKTSPSAASYTAGAADKSARSHCNKFVRAGHLLAPRVHIGYIIVFKPHVTQEQIEEYISNVQKQGRGVVGGYLLRSEEYPGGKVTHRYDIIKASIFQGSAMRILIVA